MGLRLGLLSTAPINDAIVRAAASSEAVDIVAVRSRSEERARAYLADPWHARSPGVVDQRVEDVEQIEVERADAYRIELEDLAEAVATGRPPLLGRDDAVGQARVIERLIGS